MVSDNFVFPSRKEYYRKGPDLVILDDYCPTDGVPAVTSDRITRKQATSSTRSYIEGRECIV